MKPSFFFNYFKHVPEDLVISSTPGVVISVLGTLLMASLFFMQLMSYMELRTKTELVVDDLLDVTQTAEHIGKATNKDHGMGKLTYPGLLGVEESRRVVKELEQRAIDALQPLGSEADPLRDLGRFMAIRTK